MIGERLKKLRKERKWTQEDVAKKLNIPRSTYSNYESGKREPDFETAQLFAGLFEVSIDYLLGRTDDKQATVQKDPVDKLIEYLELELTDEEIMERMTFKVDDLTLSDEEVREFIAFVRAKRFMKKTQHSGASIKEDI